MRDSNFFQNDLLVCVLLAAIVTSLDLPPLQSLNSTTLGDLILPGNFTLPSNVSDFGTTIPTYECDKSGGDAVTMRVASCVDAAQKLLLDVTHSAKRILAFKDRRGTESAFDPDVVLPYLALSCTSILYSLVPGSIPRDHDLLD